MTKRSAEAPGSAPCEGVVKPLPQRWFVTHDTNAEMRWSAVAPDGPLTPNERFFVRSHTRTPMIDPTTYRLRVFGDGLRDRLSSDEARCLTMSELTAMPRTTLAALLECTGNGRSLFQEQQGMKVPGTPWKLGAVGAATWTGVALSHVLESVGLADNAVDIMAVGLDDPYLTEGVDHGSVRRPLPVEKAVDDCLLAYEMNGEPLPPDHGFPLRLVVPGWVGIASIKWLGSLEASTRRLSSPWNTYWYRMRGGRYAPDAPPLTVSPVRSAFELDWDATIASAVEVVLHGRSWSGYGPIVRVDVSLDSGETWQRAQLDEDPGRYLWRRWSVRWSHPRPGSHELLARASDEAGNTQPADVAYNDEGYLFWAVVRHPVRVV